MAVKSSLIKTTDLDFQEISENLKTYLKGQDTFKDYDFEGSNIEGVARFYAGFGASKTSYSTIIMNRLPFYFKWLKSF